MKYYNISQIRQMLREYPYPKSRLGFVRFVKNNPAIFAPKIIGEGNGRRYYFSEKDLEKAKQFFD